MSDFPRPPSSEPPSPFTGWGGNAPQPGALPPPPPPPVGAWRGAGLRPVGDFMSASFALLGKAVVPVLPILILIAVPTVLSFIAADAALGLTAWLDDVFEALQNTPQGVDPVIPALDASDGAIVMWATIVITVNVIGAALAFVSGTVALIEAHEHRNPTWTDVLRLSASAAGPLIGVVISGSLIAVAGCTVLILMIAVLGPIGLLLLLAAIPVAFWLYARLGVVIPVAVIERRGFSAFGRSFQLTAGNGWGVLGRSLLFTMLLGLAAQVISTPIGFVAGLFGSAVIIFATIVSALVTLASQAATQAGPLVLYHDLVRVQSGPGQGAASPNAPAVGWAQPLPPGAPPQSPM